MTPLELRDAYAIPALTIRDAERQADMNASFVWTAWACATERPQFPTPAVETAGLVPLAEKVTYTNNWPAERLIDNEPTGPVIVWSVISFVLLLAGVGALAWYYAVIKHKEEEPTERNGTASANRPSAT